MNRREQLPRGARPEPRREAAQPSTAGIQKLQQTAGNRAVTGLIQRRRSRYHLLEGGLTLDPELEAMMRRLGKPKPELFDPEVLERVAKGPQDWTPLPKDVRKEPEPIVPRGEGPAEPRAGKPGDVWDAVKKVPMVKKGLDKLEEEAKRRWRKARGK